MGTMHDHVSQYATMQPWKLDTLPMEVINAIMEHVRGILVSHDPAYVCKRGLKASSLSMSRALPTSRSKYT